MFVIRGNDWKVHVLGRSQSNKVWIALAALLCTFAVVFLFNCFQFVSPGHRHAERKESWTGGDFASQTDVQVNPSASDAAPGWDSERVWSGKDDWEPFIAADRSSAYVYQMVTRFNARVSRILIRRSADGGTTWLPDQEIAPTTTWQADPQVQVAADGTVYAAWLDGPDWTSKLVKSYDHGATWTKPVVIAPSLGWTDHPWLLVSPDGHEVYVGLNKDDSYIVTSQDGGETFGAPYKTNSPTPGHWWDANGAAMAPDGTAYFVVINFFLFYRGPAEVWLVSSHNRGATWQTRLLDVSAPPPGCRWASGCKYGFFATTAGLAIDRKGKMLVAYHAGEEAKEPQPMWISTSDDGRQWTRRLQISQPNENASNGFPAVAAGPGADDFRVIWQGNGNGNRAGWDTYYRRTTDGGKTWSKITKLSNRSTGAPYKTPAGYLFPYGDYLSLSVDGQGRDYAIWGEGASYDGPGGAWYTRHTR